MGAKGGAEALVHAARLYLLRVDGSRAFVKVELKNAFNSVRRDTVLATVLEAIAEHCPDLLAFATSACGAPSQLWLAAVASAEVVQRCDPLL